MERCEVIGPQRRALCLQPLADALGERAFVVAGACAFTREALEGAGEAALHQPLTFAWDSLSGEEDGRCRRIGLQNRLVLCEPVGERAGDRNTLAGVEDCRLEELVPGQLSEAFMGDAPAVHGPRNGQDAERATGWNVAVLAARTVVVERGQTCGRPAGIDRVHLPG